MQEGLWGLAPPRGRLWAHLQQLTGLIEGLSGTVSWCETSVLLRGLEGRVKIERQGSAPRWHLCPPQCPGNPRMTRKAQRSPVETSSEPQEGRRRGGEGLQGKVGWSPTPPWLDKSESVLKAVL